MPIHHRTPLVLSDPLTATVGAPVWLKLESAQPCGSFKLRGMGSICARSVDRGATHLVTSSGGNAGYAVAWAGRELGVPVTVVVPNRTSPAMRARIAATGAEVRVVGQVWDDAHEHASVLAPQLGGAYIHPFDHPDIWDGHASLIHEVHDTGLRPGVILVAVGGGGLLAGLVQGMAEVGWGDTLALAIETEGAASYARALEAGRPVRIPAIDTIALTMGAKQVCDRAFEASKEHPIRSVLVSDAAAVRATARFLDDHRTLVEPACGAVLSVAYDALPEVRDRGPVLVVVCGGADVSLEQLRGWTP